jgi:hypothetical protein
MWFFASRARCADFATAAFQVQCVCAGVLYLGVCGAARCHVSAWAWNGWFFQLIV